MKITLVGLQKCIIVPQYTSVKYEVRTVNSCRDIKSGILVAHKWA